jgi:hypothetical protein
MTASIPRVGDLASYGHGGDSYPYTVIAVSKSGHKVTLQRRRWRCTKGNHHHEASKRVLTWEDPEGEVMVATRRKDGAYRVGRAYARQPSVRFGHASVSIDPHF